MGSSLHYNPSDATTRGFSFGQVWGKRKHGADPQPMNAACGTGESNKPGLVQAAEIYCCYLITYPAYPYMHTHILCLLPNMYPRKTVLNVHQEFPKILIAALFIKREK